MFAVLMPWLQHLCAVQDDTSIASTHEQYHIESISCSSGCQIDAVNNETSMLLITHLH